MARRHGKMAIQNGRRRQAQKKTQGFAFARALKPSLVPLATTLFLIALPHIGGTNDLLWTGILLAAILTAGSAAFVGQFWRRQPLEFSTAEFALLAFVAWQWLTLTVSVYRFATLTEAARWTAFAVAFMAVRRLGDSERNALWLAVAFVAGATLTALQGLKEYAFNAASGDLAWRIFGPFLNPNLFANYLLLAFFVALALVLARPKGWMALPTLVALLLLVAMALTGSKGALLAWLVGMFVFGMLTLCQQAAHLWQRWRWGMLLTAIGVTALFIGLVIALPPLKVRFETALTQQVHSWMFRWLVWKATVLGAASKPLLGFGAGAFEWAYPQFTAVGFTRHAHSGFLQTSLESGFFGLALLLVFFGSVVLTALSEFGSGEPTRETKIGGAGAAPSKVAHWLPIGCLAAVVAFCLHNWVETAWLAAANLLALAVVCGVANLGAKCASPLPGRWQVVLLLPLLVGVWHSFSIAQGAYFVRKGQGEFLPSARLYWLERASTADPLNARHRIDRAILLEALAEANGDTSRLREALSLCEEAIRLQPTRSGNYKVKARLMQKLGKGREAETALQKALRFNRTDTEALLRLGELLENRGKVEEAMGTCYRRLIALERSAYGRYKPLEQWQDIYIAAGKVRLAQRLLEQGQRRESLRLLSEGEGALQTFVQHYLPVLRVNEPEAAESQQAFVQSLLNDIQHLRQHQPKKAPQNLGGEGRWR